jgi:branched-chain amino acid transport system substrate-binding protein
MRSTASLRSVAGICVAVALTAAAAGCSSSKGSSSASGGSASGSEIVIGAMGPYSGAYSGTYGGIPAILQAWAKTVNAAGGINGHQVKVVTDDLGQTPTAGPAAAHKLIDQDHAVAIVDDLDPSDGTWAAYAASKGVPVLDGTENATALTDANHFNPFLSAIGGSLAVAGVAKNAGGKLGVVYCAESPSCALSVQVYQTFGKLLGISVASATKVPASTADFTAVCQQMKDTGAQAIFSDLAAGLTSRMQDTCAQQGVAAKLVLYGQAASPDWKTDAVYRNSPVIDYVPPFFDTDVPGVRAYRDALKKYAPSVIGGTEDNSFGLAAWGSAQLFAAAAAHATGAITPASVKQGLYSLKGETLDGLAAPVTFTAGKPSVSNCYYTWSIDGSGAFTAPSSVTPTCVPDSVSAPVLQALLKASK